MKIKMKKVIQHKKCKKRGKNVKSKKSLWVQ